MGKIVFTNKAHCGGAVINGTTIQWARSREQVEHHLATVAAAHGVQPEIIMPASKRLGHDARANINGRWLATESLFDVVSNDKGLRSRKDLAILDVGGVGSYALHAKRYTCINVIRNDACSSYSATARQLPYGTNSHDLVMAESTLHHASKSAPRLVAEMARVASSHVMIIEDIWESYGSPDVYQTYLRHDPNATYRSLNAWMKLAARPNLQLQRVSFLHRVPIHVQYWATRCDLGFAPMAYMLWTKSGHQHRPPVSRITNSANALFVERRNEERGAGIACQCNWRKCWHKQR